MKPLNSQQHSTLELICKTFSPALRPGDGDDPAFFLHAGNSEAIAKHLERRLTTASKGERRQFAWILSIIETPVLCWTLTRQRRPFSAMDQANREQVLRFWAASKLPRLRRFFQSIKRIALFLTYADSSQRTLRPAWSAIGYSDSNPMMCTGHPQRLKEIDLERVQELSCDFLVVGSGAGGGVAAAELTAAGHDVLVLEKGKNLANDELGRGELEGNRTLFEKTGALATADLSTVVLSGATVGGGTTVNWMTCLPPPETVLQQWASQFGIHGAIGREFASSIAAVSQRLNVNTRESHVNSQNELLRHGCQQLGYRWQLIPRNVDGCDRCDFCCYGCQAGAKQDVRQTFLHDAIQQGGRLLSCATVERLLLRGSEVSGALVQVRQGDKVRQMNVRAGAVVLAGGAIQSPALMLRSGLHNWNIGRNLFLHPTTAVVGIHEQVVNPWSGVPQSVLCDEFSDLDGQGYGVRLEVAPLHPGFAGMGLAWHSAVDHRRLMQRLDRIANTIVICRDRSSGQVTVDADGQPSVRYRLAPADARHLMTGVQQALKIQRSAGAQRIVGPHQRLLDWVDGRDDFDLFLKRITSQGFRANDLTLFSAHQMSTCRIAGSERKGVFNPEGRSFALRNLMVADASALPTCCGVNPMVSIMSLAHYLAQFWK